MDLIFRNYPISTTDQPNTGCEDFWLQPQYCRFSNYGKLIQMSFLKNRLSINILKVPDPYFIAFYRFVEQPRVSFDSIMPLDAHSNALLHLIIHLRFAVADAAALLEVVVLDF